MACNLPDYPGEPVLQVHPGEPVLQVHPGEPVFSQRRDLLEQPLDFLSQMSFLPLIICFSLLDRPWRVLTNV